MIEFEEEVSDNLEDLKTAALLISVSILGFLLVLCGVIFLITRWWLS